jgi:hypothetical protein
MNSCKSCVMLLLCYLAPLLSLCIFYYGTDPELGYVFWRNVFRAGCGPGVRIMPRFGFDPNDLITYRTIFFTIWPTWLAVLVSSPLKQLPFRLHALLGFLWSFGGLCVTLAI